jgi:sec-independent protein translocase protein TatC
MTRRAETTPDPEDLFADTRMSFGDHLEELRVHLWRAILGFLVAMVLSFAIGKPAMYAFIVRPVETQLDQFYKELQVKRANEVLKQHDQDQGPADGQERYVEIEFTRQQLKAVVAGEDVKPLEDPKAVPAKDWVRMQMRIPDPIRYAYATADAQRLLEPPRTLKTFSITEAFMVYFKICLVCGLVLGSPWIFWQIWMFVAAGLYPHEKRYVHYYMPMSLLLFIAGVLACHWVVMPKAISALLWFNEWLNLEPDLRLNEWLGFAIWVPVIFGLSFQTPLVMLFLERIGLFTVETYRSKRRIAFFILAFISAIGPTIDAFSMMFQWVALCLLYQLGIWLCVWSPRKPELDIDVPESEEMVEV